MTDTKTEPLEPGDTVTLVSRMLFNDDQAREGTVTAVADNGKVTAEFPQDASFPLIVTSDAEHFTHVRKAPEPVGFVVLCERTTGARLVVGIVYDTADAATEAAEGRRRSDFGAEGTFAVCRLIPEEVASR